jgi:hypothetical protein
VCKSLEQHDVDYYLQTTVTTPLSPSTCTHRKAMGPQNAVSNFNIRIDHGLKLDQRACGFHGLKARLSEGSVSQKIVQSKWYVPRLSHLIALMSMISERKASAGRETGGVEWDGRVVTDSGGRKYGFPSGRKRLRRL